LKKSKIKEREALKIKEKKEEMKTKKRKGE
jgi:hypothetical protein